MKTKPILFEYMSATSYLYDLMLFRKSVEPGFTFESWACELGFKSRSFLNMVLNQERNITPQFIDALAASTAFSTDEKTYFSFLVLHNQSSSESEKINYLDRLLEFKGKQKDLVEIQNHKAFLSSPLMPKLLVLLSFIDIDRRLQGLSEFLREDTSKIEMTLKQLEALQLASSVNGIWSPTKKSFKVPKNLGAEALAEYHNHSLQEAMAAQKLPSALRRYRSLLLPLSESDYENLLLDIEALASKAVAKYDSDLLHEKRLYKLNMNIFPVTEEFIFDAHNSENETRLLKRSVSSDTESEL